MRWELAAARGRVRLALESAPDQGAAHVYIAVGLNVEALRSLTRTVSLRWTVAADHIPVVLTDNRSFGLARADGVLLEYLPDAHTWRRHRPGTGWDDLLTERLTRIFHDFGCARTIVVDPDTPPSLPDLLR